MHLLDLLGRPKVLSAVTPSPAPRRVTAVHVVSRPVASRPAPIPSTRTGQAPQSAPAPNDLRRLIFAAVASNDSKQLATIFREYPGSVVERADWMKIPDELRSNPAAVRWYSEGLRAVARYCAERLNRPDLFRRLEELGLSTPESH